MRKRTLLNTEAVKQKIMEVFIPCAYSFINGISVFLGKLLSEEGIIGKNLVNLRTRKLLLEFGERDDDIYVCTFPRSGTTWVQMILYLLTTEGRMDFNHIYEVSPFPEYSGRFDKPLANTPPPRIIKTLAPYEIISKRKGRLIYIVRNGIDVTVSLFHLRKAYMNPEYRIEEAFNFILDEWFTHVSSWIANNKNRDILFLKYEELLKDPESSIRKIADYCRIRVDDSRLPGIMEKSSFDFMKKHESKFGDQPPENVKTYNNFIREGKANQGKDYFTREQMLSYRAKFRKYFSKVDFMKSYYTED